MALPFLKAESEETATQAMAFIGIIIITIGLTLMNVTGALASSEGTSLLQLTIRGALALILSGAELLAAVVLVRVMLAPNRLRQVIGSLIFIGLAWACIQNGKRAVHLIYPEFEYSASLLEAKSEIAGSAAQEQALARAAAIEAAPKELARIRGEIADLRSEQALMAAQSPEKIRQAQAMLIANGLYFGDADGKRGPLTEAAMRARGEEIGNEMQRLKLIEQSLANGSVSVGITATDNAAISQAELADKAKRAAEAAIWLEVMLWVFEAARSFGLWALVTTITAKSTETKDPVRVEAGKKAANTKKRRKRQSEKIEQQAESYMSHYKHALRLARNTNWTAEGIASNAFKLPAGGMEDRLNLMVRADLIPQDDVELIMRRAEKPEGKQNAVDDINAPLQLTNGEDKGDADDTADNTSDIS